MWWVVGDDLDGVDGRSAAIDVGLTRTVITVRVPMLGRRQLISAHVKCADSVSVCVDHVS
jgi:hypothetical protein